MKKALIAIMLAIYTCQPYANSTKQHKHKHHKDHLHTLYTSKSPTIANVSHSNSQQTGNLSEDIPEDFFDSAPVTKNQPKLYSYSAIALNAKTDKVIVSKHSNVKLPIASITKLMTAMVLLDSGVNLDDYVTISDSDIDTLRNTHSRLKVGMQFKRKDLLLLALMSSENRATHALARTTYQEGTNLFIRKMNEKAKSIGMTNTEFYDPTGLTNQNRSTAFDLTKMVKEAYSYKEIKQDTTTKDADVMFGPNYIHRYINSDILVRHDNKIEIKLSKTGFINEAGHCLVLYSIIDNEPVVMVFLNSAGKSGRIIDAMVVKNYLQKNRFKIA